MANINQISPDGGTTVYDIEDTTARSGVNSLTSRVGIVEGKVSTLEGQMLSVEDDLDALGTASTKNSTSTVTDSTDLVESGAVYSALQGKADNTVIGNVENSASSTHAYSSGQGFICDGQFRVAKGSGIAVSEQITDSNSDVKPIADCLPTRVEDITSEFTFSTDCSWVTNWTKVKKIGRMITVVLRFTTPGTVSNDKSIITFPAKYKPIQLNDYSYSLAGLLGKTFSGEHAGLATFYVSDNEYGIRLASNQWLANTAVVTQFTYMI